MKATGKVAPRSPSDLRGFFRELGNKTLFSTAGPPDLRRNPLSGERTYNLLPRNKGFFNNCTYARGEDPKSKFDSCRKSSLKRLRPKLPIPPKKDQTGPRTFYSRHLSERETASMQEWSF